MRMMYQQSKDDPCLLYKRDKEGELSILISFIDDLQTLGNKHVVESAKNEMMNQIDCEDVGELQEHIGCKIEINKEKKTARLTQPGLLQRLRNEFVLPNGTVDIPATAGTTLAYKDEGVHYLKAEKSERILFRS